MRGGVVVVVAAAALRWRRWRRCRENKASALVAAETTTAMMEAVEKEVAMTVGWLDRSACRTDARHGEGQGLSHAPSLGGCRGGPGSAHWTYTRKLRKGTDEDVIMKSLC